MWRPAIGSLPLPAEPPPLEIILKDIEKAVREGTWYLALAGALSLPDICSMLEQPPEEAWSTRAKYAAWYDKNSPVVPHLTGDDCYSLRGGVLHSGKFGHKRQRYDRIVFTTPDSRMRLHGALSIRDGVTYLAVDLEMFCGSIILAVRRWYERHKDDQNVRQNVANIVRYRPLGYPPHYVGMPVLA